MNLFQNITIRSRFTLISVSVVLLIVAVVVFFILTFNKLSNYTNYNESIDNLKINYLNMRRFEQHFLLRYREEPSFFITGENKYIEKLHNSSEQISLITTKLISDPITEDLELTEKIFKIETIHAKYSSIFDDLADKIYKRGSINTGIIGDLKSSATQALNSTSTQKSVVIDMIQAVDNYLYTNDEKYYTDFLKIYRSVIYYSSSVQISENDSLIEDETENINMTGEFNTAINTFKNNFSSLIKINKLIGLSYREGLEGQLRSKSHEFDQPIEDLVSTVYKSRNKVESSTRRNIYIFFSLLTILFLILFWRFSNSIVNPLNKLKKFIEPLSLGVLPKEKQFVKGKNEISDIAQSINDLIEGLKKTSSFASSIGEGKYSTEFVPLSKNDVLGNALIEMRENLISAGEEETKRKYEDEIRTWKNVGLTKFNDILRQSQGNIKEMSVAVISELVKFINANQGGVFVFNDDEDDRYLELTAAYAYGHEKKKEKKVYPGEGIVGTVAIEKERVYMTEIPESYITITSGLGGATPRSLLIVPMIVEDDVIGVIELASFNELKTHEIEFVETLSENIASSLSITKINQRTAILLEQSQKQAEMMKIQEEEMRQNFEELQQIQEDSSRRSAEMTSILSAIDTSSLVIEIDLNRNIISVNRGLLELLNVPESLLAGMNHKDFVQSVSDEEYEEFWRRLMNHENIQKNEHLKIEEKEYWFSVVYAPIFDDAGNILYILAIATDLSESKLLEIELKDQETKLIQKIDELNKAKHILENTNEMMRANEKTLQSAVESAMKQRKEITKKAEEIAEEEALSKSRLEGINQTNVTLELDLEGNIIKVNKMFEEIFKYKENDIKSKNLTILLKEKYIESESFKNMWEDLKRGKHSSGNFDFIGKNKLKVFLQGTFTAIRDRRGKTSKVFFIGFDTTDLVKRTEELKARETELSFQLEDLQKLQEKLKGKK